MPTTMTPRRPYMLRAFYDWLLENELTPHLVVDATLRGVRVPVEFIQNGQIILNLSPRAIGNLELGNDNIRFNARFGGQPQTVIVPLYAVQAIYARENGAGTMFEMEEAYEQELLNDVEDNKREAHFEVVSETKHNSEALKNNDTNKQLKEKPTLRVIK